MTQLIQALARVPMFVADAVQPFHLTAGGAWTAGSAVSFVFGLVGVWSLWRVRRLLAVLPAYEQRIESLTNSVALLTDTTESCFKAVSMQLQFMQSQNTTKPSKRPAEPVHAAHDAGARKARQRRIVGAARRGEALAAIAAREGVAEGEVSLRLSVDGAAGSARAGRAGEAGRAGREGRAHEPSEVGNGPLFL